MRSILNISLPKKMKQKIKKEVKKGNFASVSEFLRHLIRQWERGQLEKELNQEREKFENGKGKTLKSLKELR